MPSSSDEPLVAPGPAVRELPCGSRRCSSVARSRSAASSGSRSSFLAPALDAARGLEPGDRGDELRAGEVVRGRKRVARVVVRRLLRDRGRAERAARRLREGTRAAGGRAVARRARGHPSRPIVAPACLAWARRHCCTPLTMKSRSPGRTRLIRRASRESASTVAACSSRACRRVRSWRSSCTSAARCVQRRPGLEVARDRLVVEKGDEAGGGDHAPAEQHGRALRARAALRRARAARALRTAVRAGCWAGCHAEGVPRHSAPSSQGKARAGLPSRALSPS